MTFFYIFNRYCCNKYTPRKSSDALDVDKYIVKEKNTYDTALSESGISGDQQKNTLIATVELKKAW